MEPARIGDDVDDFAGTGNAASGQKRNVFLAYGALVIGVMLVFWPAIRNGFVDFDDPVYILENPHVQAGLNWRDLEWAFTTGHGANWHPITWMSHMLDDQLFRLDGRGYHLTSVLLHALNTALLFAFLRSATGMTARSFAVAALFGIHPLHVESVAWISERKDVLSTLFWMLGLLTYQRWVSRIDTSTARRTAFYLLTIISFCLGLMSKPMVVTFPIALLLLDYWPLGRFSGEVPFARRLIKLTFEKWLFFLLTAVSAVITYFVQRQGGAMEAKDYFPLVVRATNIPISYCRYLGKIFLPINLTPFYIHPRYWPIAEIVTATLLLLAITWLIFRVRRIMPYALTGWAWFIITLLPVIGIIQVGTQSIADRYTYLPSVGIFIVICWAVPDLVAKLRYHRLLTASATAAVLLACGIAAHAQVAYWKDTETLFRHALSVEPANGLAHLNLGAGLAEQGRTDEAMKEVREALRLDNGIAEAHLTLGRLFADKKDYNNAILSYSQGLAIHPTDAKGHLFLGIALHWAGNLPAATEEFKTAARLRPELIDAFNNLGVVLRKQGRFDEAIDAYREGLAIQPAFADAHNNLAIALFSNGRIDDAITEFRAALKLNPESSQFHKNLGLALEQSNQSAQAVGEYKQALRLDPKELRHQRKTGSADWQKWRCGTEVASAHHLCWIAQRLLLVKNISPEHRLIALVITLLRLLPPFEIFRVGWISSVAPNICDETVSELFEDLHFFGILGDRSWNKIAKSNRN